MDDEDFGFTVERVTEKIEHGQWVRVEDQWGVYLPHQCSNWDIAGESLGGTGGAVPHAEAVSRLEAFIAEANQALTALCERRPTKEDEPFMTK